MVGKGGERVGITVGKGKGEGRDHGVGEGGKG